MKEVNSMLERDMSDMVNVMLEQALGYFVAMRSLQESFNEQLSEASHRYLAVIADDAASITSQLSEVTKKAEHILNFPYEWSMCAVLNDEISNVR